MELFEILVENLTNLETQFFSKFNATEHIASGASLYDLLRTFSKTRSSTTNIDKENLKTRIFYPIINCLFSEIKSRSSVYKGLYDDFKFLVHLREMDDPFLTNVTDERSFSELKYIKNNFRNSMSFASKKIRKMK